MESPSSCKKKDNEKENNRLCIPYSRAPINTNVLGDMYFRTAAPYCVTLFLFPTERKVIPESATHVSVLVPLFMNSCSLPNTMPVYAVTVTVTGEADITGVNRLRCIVPSVTFPVIVPPTCLSFPNSRMFV